MICLKLMKTSKSQKIPLKQYVSLLKHHLIFKELSLNSDRVEPSGSWDKEAVIKDKDVPNNIVLHLTKGEADHTKEIEVNKEIREHIPTVKVSAIIHNKTKAENDGNNKNKTLVHFENANHRLIVDKNQKNRYSSLAVALKTGREVVHARVPIQFLTFLKDIENFVVIGNFYNNIK